MLSDKKRGTGYFLRLRVKNYRCPDAVIINTQLRKNLQIKKKVF